MKMLVSKIHKVKRFQVMEEAVRLIFKFENFDTYIIENTLIRDYGTRTINPNKSSTRAQLLNCGRLPKPLA